MTSRVSCFLGARVASLLEHEGAAAAAVAAVAVAAVVVAAVAAAAAARGRPTKNHKKFQRGEVGGSIHASRITDASRALDLGDDVSKARKTSSESDLKHRVCWSFCQGGVPTVLPSIHVLIS
jgi:hypothetical protein